MGYETINLNTFI